MTHPTSRRDSHLCPFRPMLGFTIIELLVVLAIIGILLVLFLPSVHRGREPGRRMQCKNNLKQIGLALHNYHDAYGAFPPAYTVDTEGQPLHSWRTLILPYMDQKPLYDKIDLSKPWDEPANAEAFRASLPSLICPSSASPPGQTTYLAVVTPQSCLRPEKSSSIREITDGPSNTILVIEVDAAHAVPWMAPTDADEALLLNFRPKLKTSHTGGFHVLLGDGTGRFFSENVPNDIRRALITMAGGETVGEF